MTPEKKQSFTAQELFKITDDPKARRIIIKYGDPPSDNRTQEQEAYLSFARDFHAKMFEIFPLEKRQEFLLLSWNMQQQIANKFMQMQKNIFFAAHAAYKKHLEESEKENSSFIQQIYHLAVGSERRAFDLHEWLETKRVVNPQSGISLSIKSFQSSLESTLLKAQTPLGEPEGLQYSLIDFKKALLVIDNILSENEDLFLDNADDEFDIETSSLNDRNIFSDNEEWDTETMRVKEKITAEKKDLISNMLPKTVKELSQDKHNTLKQSIHELEKYWVQAGSIGYLLDSGIIASSTPSSRVSQIGSFLSQVNTLGCSYREMIESQEKPEEFEKKSSEFIGNAQSMKSFFSPEIEKYVSSLDKISQIERGFFDVGQRLNTLTLLSWNEMLGNYKNMRQSYFYAYQISLKSIIESLSSDDIDSLNNPKQPNSLIQIRAHLDSMIKSLDDFEKSEHHPPILIRAFISKFNELITHLTESLKRRFTRKDSQTLQSSSSLKQNSPSRHLYLQTENLSIRGKYHPNH